MEVLIVIYGFLTILAFTLGVQVFIMGGDDIWHISDDERRKGAAIALFCPFWPVFLAVWLVIKFYEMAVYLKSGEST